MGHHLRREVDKVKDKLLQLGADVEESLRQAVDALQRRDGQAAQQVIDSDRQIDLMEVEVEEDCLKILALYQPVAVDLRFIITVLKINNDLERVGDLASSIAERVHDLSQWPDTPLRVDFTAMAMRVQGMLRQSLDAMVNLDAEMARGVCAADDEVDALNRSNFRRVEAQLAESPQQAGSLLGQLSVSRYLERIADHATNIAEDVIYMIQGEIARHGGH